MAKYSKEVREQALGALREVLKPGQQVFTVLRHCSRSGMSRSISLLSTDGDDTRQLDHHVARALGLTCDEKNGGVKIGGCGMDMGFALVYELGAKLWPNGTPHPHGSRNGAPDSDGGYALKQRWL